jgi:hypothetical protein
MVLTSFRAGNAVLLGMGLLGMGLVGMRLLGMRPTRLLGASAVSRPPDVVLMTFHPAAKISYSQTDA